MNGDREESRINGPDDAIAILGDVALWSVIDSAPLCEESARRDAEEAIRDLRAQREQAKSKPAEVVILNCDDAIESIAVIADEKERMLFVGQLAAVRIPGLTKALIEKAAKAKPCARGWRLPSESSSTRNTCVWPIHRFDWFGTLLSTIRYGGAFLRERRRSKRCSR